VIGFKSCAANIDAGPLSGIAEGFHCDGGIATFTLIECGTVRCSFGVRIANENSGNIYQPNLCYLSKLPVDHSNGVDLNQGLANPNVHGISFENGSAMSLRDSVVTATYAKNATNYAIFVGPNYGGQLDIQNNDIFNNGAGGIGVGANDVIIQSNRIRANATGAPQSSGFGLSGINVLSTVNGGIQIETI
jgi:hypothetical protein